jgi:hypothetical protein
MHAEKKESQRRATRRRSSCQLLVPRLRRLGILIALFMVLEKEERDKDMVQQRLEVGLLDMSRVLGI